MDEPPEPLDIKIVALTAFTEESMRARAKEVGMVDYLTKPIRAPDLKAIMDKYVFEI